METASGDVTLVSDDICQKEDTDHSTTSDGMNYELNASWLPEYCVSPTQDLWFGPGQHPGLSMDWRDFFDVTTVYDDGRIQAHHYFAS